MHRDLFGRPMQASPLLTREGRILALRRFVDELLAGRMPERVDVLFAAGGVAAYLERGGDLVRDFWRIAAPRGSHRTPERVAARLVDTDPSGRGRQIPDSVD